MGPIGTLCRILFRTRRLLPGASRFVVLVLEGPHSGAVFELQDGGSHTVGTDESSDILLLGRDHEPVQCRIDCTTTGCSLTVPESTSLSLDGIPLSGQTVPLAPEQMCRLEDHGFVVRHSTAQAMRTSRRYTLIDSDASMRMILRMRVTRWYHRSRLRMLVLTGRLRQPNSRPLVAVWGSTVIVLVVAVGTLYGFFKKQDTERSRILSQITSYVTDTFEPGAMTVTDTNGVLSIRGYVDSWQQKEQLLIKIQEYPYEFSVSIAVREQIRQSVDMLLKESGHFVHVAASDSGTVEVSGVCADLRALDSVLAASTATVPGIAAIVNRCVPAQHVFAFLNPRLSRTGLTDRMTLAIYRGDVVAFGHLNSTDSLHWRRIKAALGDSCGLLVDDTWPLGPEFLAGNEKTPNAACPRSFGITVVGNTRYISLAKNHKFFTGSSGTGNRKTGDPGVQAFSVRDGGELITFRFGEFE